MDTEATPNDAVQTVPVWRDSSVAVDARVEALVEAMTLNEKLAQLIGVWVGASADGGEVAPHQNEMYDDVDLDALLPQGLGQLTRPFGTAPVDAALGAVSLARAQERVASSNRFGIPALAHEECLAGFASWGATAYPIPLAWGATFDPGLIERMAERIGADMRSVGVHQGLAPVLDVVRDARWGRVEETIGEDPFLVARSAPRTCAGSNRRASSRRSSTSSATRPPRRGATSPRCRWASGSSPTCCFPRSRWRCATAERARS